MKHEIHASLQQMMQDPATPVSIPRGLAVAVLRVYEDEYDAETASSRLNHYNVLTTCHSVCRTSVSACQSIALSSAFLPPSSASKSTPTPRITYVRGCHLPDGIEQITAAASYGHQTLTNAAGPRHAAANGDRVAEAEEPAKEKDVCSIKFHH